MDLDAPSVAFGVTENEMPSMEEIPEDFKDYNSRNKWRKLQSDWFFKGLPQGTQFIPNEGIDPAKALRHLKGIQSSFAPKHEHKQAAVAWLMSLWFKEVKQPA